MFCILSGLFRLDSSKTNIAMFASRKVRSVMPYNIYSSFHYSALLVPGSFPLQFWIGFPSPALLPSFAVRPPPPPSPSFSLPLWSTTPSTSARLRFLSTSDLRGSPSGRQGGTERWSSRWRRRWERFVEKRKTCSVLQVTEKAECTAHRESARKKKNGREEDIGTIGKRKKGRGDASKKGTWGGWLYYHRHRCGRRYFLSRCRRSVIIVFFLLLVVSLFLAETHRLLSSFFFFYFFPIIDKTETAQYRDTTLRRGADKRTFSTTLLSWYPPLLLLLLPPLPHRLPSL